MSGDSHMSCESCQDLLTELVCDELAADVAAAARAHARACPRCGPALDKLERTLQVGLALPLLTPSPNVEKRIMQAARSALQGRAKGPLLELPDPARSGFLAWCARVGSWAMSPQVAMASVLVLMVGIGLYALPLGQDGESAGLRATEEGPAPATPATATPVPESAAEGERDEALADKAATADDAPIPERRQRELELKRKSYERRSLEAAREASAESKKEEPAPATKGRAGRGAGGKASDLDGDPFGALAGAPSKPRQERSKTDAEKASPAATNRALDEAPGGRFAPPPPAAKPPAPRADKLSAPAEAEAAAAPAQASSPQTQQRAASEAKSASGLGQGIVAAQRGDLATAQKLLGPIAQQGSQPERGQASLWLARSLRSAGDCARALSYYKTLTDAAGTPRAVLEEAADCYERTGGTAQASKLRARAAQPAGKMAE